VFQTGPDHAPLQVKTDAVAVEVTSDVAKRELIPLVGRLSTPTCADGNRLQILKDSLASARSLAGGAATDILSHPNGPEYTTYFGGNTQSDIWFNMDRIAGDLASSGTRRYVESRASVPLFLIRFISIHCTGDPANLCAANSGVIASVYYFVEYCAIF
jgi:hypothetical protein